MTENIRFLGEVKTRVIIVANMQGNCTWKQIHLTRVKLLCFHSITFISEHTHRGWLGGCGGIGGGHAMKWKWESVMKRGKN